MTRVMEELSKAQQTDLIHPSDKKYTETLKKRQQAAQENGGFVNPLFFQERVVAAKNATA